LPRHRETTGFMARWREFRSVGVRL
jgi:hypothetical protein